VVPIGGTAGEAPALHTTLQPPAEVPPPVSPFPSSPEAINPSADYTKPLHHGFWDRCRDVFDFGHGAPNNRCWFQSDHGFDDKLTSPVTEPFYFEDPRSLTEVRPIAIFESAPSRNPIFRGGATEFFGLQGRVAFTERLSLVINELGIVSLNPNAPTEDFRRDTSFAEVRLGPKYTFFRNPAFGGVAAVGLTFGIPAGDGRAFQDTGTLSLNPYVTYAQNFGRSSFGSFNFIGALGFDFATDSERSEFFHSHFHFDYDVLNSHKFFPLFELNYWRYTRTGRLHDFGFEGADLVNFGSTTAGKDYLTLAVGARYHFTENIQAGGAIEFPTTAERGLADFRVTFDVIFRY
jgi:hypothetical protein